LFKIVENYASVGEKREWIKQWKFMPFTEQLLAASCLHGLLFSSLQVIVHWLKNRGRKQFDHELIEIFEKMIHDQVSLEF
jgi:hypothetical protein